MKAGMKILYSGIVVVIIGVVIYFIGNWMVNNVLAYNVGGLPISDFMRTVNSDINNYYIFGQLTSYAGGLLFIVGIVLLFIGGITAVVSSEKEFYDKSKASSKPIQKIVQNVTPSPVVKDTSSRDEAISILRTRYAKGEVTKEQYDQMKKDLE
jgi:hypothetical protein